MKISDIMDDPEIIIKEDNKYYEAKYHNCVYDGWDGVEKVILEKGKRISRKELLK